MGGMVEVLSPSFDEVLRLGRIAAEHHHSEFTVVFDLQYKRIGMRVPGLCTRMSGARSPTLAIKATVESTTVRPSSG